MAAFTITVDEDTSCLDMDFTDSVDCTLDMGSYALSVYGDFTAVSGLTVTPGTSTLKMEGNTKTF